MVKWAKGKDGKEREEMDEKKTHKYGFTKKQEAQLRRNPNVHNVSQSTIRFTTAFKKQFYERRIAGETPWQIFLSAGIDPEILGKERISGFCHTVNMQSKRMEGFEDQRKGNLGRAVKQSSSVEKRIRDLEHELAYTRQEVEFLKKLQKANTEARKEWESKHRPK